MADLHVGDRVLALDEDGFLEDPSLWDEEVAAKLAETEEVELTGAMSRTSATKYPRFSCA